jgi:hypothetical protein
LGVKAADLPNPPKWSVTPSDDSYINARLPDENNAERRRKPAAPLYAQKDALSDLLRRHDLKKSLLPASDDALPELLPLPSQNSAERRRASAPGLPPKTTTKALCRRRGSSSTALALRKATI